MVKMSEFGEEGAVEGPLNIVTREEVEGASLMGMKNSKAARLSGMTSDLLKFAGATGVRELLRMFQGIMGGEHVPDEWRNSLTIPLYKGKGDALQCGNYRGLRLLEHGMKVWERVLNERLKRAKNVGENQFGFRVGKSTAGAIFIV